MWPHSPGISFFVRSATIVSPLAIGWQIVKFLNQYLKNSIVNKAKCLPNLNRGVEFRALDGLGVEISVVFGCGCKPQDFIVRYRFAAR
jgi:hypothetical protein